MNRGFGLLAAVLVGATPLVGSAQTSAPAPAPAPAEQKVTITPYGFILTQAMWDSGPFATRDFPGQVLTNGEGGAFLISARGTRFGFKVGVPDDPFTGARINGVIEADFKAGHINTNSNAWYNAVMRLRLAYAQASWGGPDLKLTLVAGQDWSVVAPVNGVSLAWGYDPIFYQAGNLWKRGPQIKAALDVGGPVGFTLAGAVASPADAVNPSVPGIAANADYGVGNRSRTPGFEGRVAVNVKSGKAKVVELGVSGAMQKRRYNTPGTTFSYADATVKVGVVDATFNFPFVTIQGEAFLNDGYSDAFQGIQATGGNVAQTTVFPAGAPAGAAGLNLESKGFFVEAILKPIPQIFIPVGYGVEQLRDAATSPGIVAANRTKGSQFHAGLLFNMTNPWQFGFEWCHTISGYGRAAPAISKDADQFALTSKLNF